MIIDDKLNIAEELESEMAENIKNYQCEWKTTIENPEKLKRFKHFINSENTDSALTFVTEREQRFPASTAADEPIKILELTE